jgi:hypothetical protein
VFFISGCSDQHPKFADGDCWMQKPLDFPRLVEIVSRLVTHEKSASVCV